VEILRDFRVSVTACPPFTVIALDGELDALTEPELRQRVTVLAHSGDLLFDLTGLRFIDSSGIRVILDSFMRARLENGSVSICGLSSHLRHLFTLMGITPRVTAYDTVDDAIAQASRR
jgi:anti-sigma B factor antagonist